MAKHEPAPVKLHKPNATIMTVDIERMPGVVETYDRKVRGGWLPAKRFLTEPRTVSIAAKVYDGPMFYVSEWDHGADAVGAMAFEVLNRADVLYTWNGDRFDIPLLRGDAFRYAGRLPAMPQSVDLIKTARNLRFFSCSLDDVSHALSLAGKLPHDDLIELGHRCEAGDAEARGQWRAYNMRGVEQTEILADILRRAIRNHPHAPATRRNLVASSAWTDRCRRYRGSYRCSEGS